jgi:hypothetical protein
MRALGRGRTNSLVLMSFCLGGVLGLNGLGCRAIVGIESRSEVLDADSADGGVDARFDADASLDADAPADANCDADADIDAETGCPPCDAGVEAEAAAPSVCNAMPERHLFDEPDSGFPPLGPALSGPRMGRLDGVWSMVWLGDDYESVLQLAIDDNGDDSRHDALVPTSPGATYVDPMLAAADDRMILGVSRRMTSGAHAVDIYAFDPLTGTVLDGAVSIHADPVQKPLVLSGIAFAPNKNRFLTVTREAAYGGVAGPVSVQLFQAKPLALLNERAVDKDLSPVDAYHAAVAWSETAQRFGVAYLDTQSVPGGWLALFDLQLEQTESESEFTSGLWPMADAGLFELSVTAMGDDFVVAWLDRFDAPPTGYPEHNLDVYAVSIDAVTGIASSPGVKVSDAKSTRQYVKVLNDGASYLVAWLEKDTLANAIRAQRLDTDLQPRGGLIEVGKAGEAYQGPFGAAVAAERDYGFVSIAPGANVYFNRIVCIDP